MFEDFLKGYAAIGSKTSAIATIVRTQPLHEHSSHMIAKDSFEDASGVLEDEATAIVEKLRTEFGDNYEECVSESYQYGSAAIGGKNLLISYNIRVVKDSAIVVYDGRIINF